MNDFDFDEKSWPGARGEIAAGMNEHSGDIAKLGVAVWGKDGNNGLVGIENQRKGQRKLVSAALVWISIVLSACTAMLGWLTWRDANRPSEDRPAHHSYYDDQGRNAPDAAHVP